MGLRVEEQKQCSYYEQQIVGEYIADLIVGRLILSLKLWKD